MHAAGAVHQGTCRLDVWQRLAQEATQGRHGRPCCVAHADPGLAPPPLPLPGTEIAGSFLTGSPLLPQAPATFSTPAVGHCPVLLVQREDGGQAASVHGDDGAGAAGSSGGWVDPQPPCTASKHTHKKKHVEKMILPRPCDCCSCCRHTLATSLFICSGNG